MHFLGIYKQEFWERLNFLEAVQSKRYALFNYANSQKKLNSGNGNISPVVRCNLLL